MFLGGLNMVNPSSTLDKDMYLFFLFTCLSYLAQIVATINAVDGSDDFMFNYKIKDKD